MLPPRVMEKLPRPLRKLVSPPHRAFYDALDRWRRDGGDARLYEHPGLGPDSIVLDLGGYRGAWTARIVERYAPRVHVIEPHPGYADAIAERFAENPKVRVHSFALGSADGRFPLRESGPGSSAFRAGGRQIVCETREASAFLRDAEIPTVDLMKMNIEGGEYDLLPHLIASGFIERVGTILVQFHLLDATSVGRREQIRADLRATHDEGWCYPFVWEAWSKEGA